MKIPKFQLAHQPSKFICIIILFMTVLLSGCGDDTSTSSRVASTEATSGGSGGGAGPTVSSTSITTSAGIYTTSSTISIQIVFSAAVTVTGSPTLTLNTTHTAAYASGSGTTTLVFNYTVQSGDTTSSLDYSTTASLSLNGGTIRDSSGNAATLTLPSVGGGSSLAASHVIVLDTTAPSISSSKLKETTLGPSGTTLKLGWTAATDTVTSSGSLTYSVYQSSANPSAGSFTTVSQVESGTLFSSGNFSSVNITSGISPGNSYYFNVIVSDEAGNKSVYTPVGEFFSANIKLFYPFDGDAAETSANGGNHGILNNSPTLIADRFGFSNSAYSFTRGSSQYIESTSDTGVGNGNVAITLSLWFKGNAGDTYSTNDRLISLGSNTNNNLFGLYPSSNRMLIWTNDGSGSDFDTGASIPTSWEHWVIVHNAATQKMLGYKNGSSTTNPSSLQTSFSMIDSHLIIGKAITNDTYLSGSVDDVRVYNAALSDTEINRLYTVTQP